MPDDENLNSSEHESVNETGEEQEALMQSDRNNVTPPVEIDESSAVINVAGTADPHYSVQYIK